MPRIPTYALYGEQHLLPDLLHCERILDRAGPQGWVISAHRHPQVHQLFLIQSGKTYLTVDGTPYHLDAPVMINMPRGAVHGFEFSAGTNGYVLTLPCSEMPEVFTQTLGLGERLNHFATIPVTSELQLLFEQVLGEHRSSQTERTLMLKGLATQILCLVARALPHPIRADVPDRYSQIMADFQALVQSRFRDRLRIVDYAAALALTSTHLSRVVRDLTGASASAYVEATVFREACRQLAYTRTDIQQVGFSLGFDDPAYFSKMFRKRVGISPSQYRQQVNDGYQSS